jgi:hypothetical protein
LVVDGDEDGGGGFGVVVVVEFNGFFLEVTCEWNAVFYLTVLLGCLENEFGIF